ncbi:diaminopimelate decarboxylase [Candidatus Poribacteria bacterium]|nr:diaminopimelate decarboxylase [Candidatus Poribacteria bacterium]
MGQTNDVFTYRDGKLFCEDVSVEDLCAQHGTPLYIYSHAAFVSRFRDFQKAFAGIDPLICFAMKSNGNLAVLRALAREGAGADIVSGGELFRALRAGIDASKIVYAGPGKSCDEVRAALTAGVYMLNVESLAEAMLIDSVAGELGVRAPVALRVNPDVDARTHAHTTTGKKGNKFGIDLDVAIRSFEAAAAMPHLDVCGVHAHIGSPVMQLEPFEQAMARIVELIGLLRTRGIGITRLDFGGGLGIAYRDETPAPPSEYAERLIPLIRQSGCRLLLEPGRYISGNSGILCTRVLYRKETDTKTFVIVNGAMTDLIRPALYDSFHRIHPVVDRSADTETVDVVGPVCESGDFLAKNRELPRVDAGDYLAVFSAGAYGFAMSSNYNARPRAAEVLVSVDRAHVVRARETYDDLIRGESIPDFLA